MLPLLFPQMLMSHVGCGCLWLFLRPRGSILSTFQVISSTGRPLGHDAFAPLKIKHGGADSSTFSYCWSEQVPLRAGKLDHRALLIFKCIHTVTPPGWWPHGVTLGLWFLFPITSHTAKLPDLLGWRRFLCIGSWPALVSLCWILHILVSNACIPFPCIEGHMWSISLSCFQGMDCSMDLRRAN